jgi:iodotyrosine deiodinase
MLGYALDEVVIACGTLLAALHIAGLATLTHTPSPMVFLSEILQRPKNEKPYLLMPVGYPADGAIVSNITKKPLNEIMRVIANIDLPQRQVTTKDLPAIP